MIAKNKSGGSASGGSVEARVTVSFGGNDGPKTEVSVSAEAHDKHNSHVDFSATYSTATGQTDISVGGGVSTNSESNSSSNNSQSGHNSR